MEIGKKIKQLRFKAGLTQEQLAEKMGVGPQAVSKWETGVAMPDITALPMLAEVFGVSIDDLFDLTNEQRLNRIENRMDIEEELPQDVFMEYEEFLMAQLADEKNKKRVTELAANLYWHRMNSYAKKASRFAKEAVRANPDEKGCQWILNETDRHAVWDWNMRNHTAGVEFYREILKSHPDSRMAHYDLLDNLIADHRCDEAEKVLASLERLKNTRPVLNEVYRAHIALARFDEKTADAIIEDLVKNHEGDDEFACLFEAAQYYAEKCDYDKAIEYYEKSFENEPRRPRFQDELMGIAQICEIRGDYKKAAETYGRIVDLLENEWHFTEEVELQVAKDEMARLLAKA